MYLYIYIYNFAFVWRGSFVSTSNVRSTYQHIYWYHFQRRPILPTLSQRSVLHSTVVRGMAARISGSLQPVVRPSVELHVACCITDGPVFFLDNNKQTIHPQQTNKQNNNNNNNNTTTLDPTLWDKTPAWKRNVEFIIARQVNVRNVVVTIPFIYNIYI